MLFVANGLGYNLTVSTLDPTAGALTAITTFQNYTIPNVGYAALWDSNYVV